MYFIWQARNHLLYQSIKPNPHYILENIKKWERDLGLFTLHSTLPPLNDHPILTSPPPLTYFLTPSKSKPRTTLLLIDSSLDASSHESGWTALAFYNGSFNKSCFNHGHGGTAYEAEAQAVLEGTTNWVQVDCKHVEIFGLTHTS